MPVVSAELIEDRDLLPGRRSLGFDAPAIAATARPGQSVFARAVEDGAMERLVPFAIAGVDPAKGSLTIHAGPGARAGPGGGPGPVSRWRLGERVELTGPIGRGFELEPRSQHLLLVAEGDGLAGLLTLAVESVRSGRQVTVLAGAPSARDVYPSTLLPDEVEYVVATADGSLGHAGRVTELVHDFEAWADRAFACGPWALLAELARLAAGRRARLGVAALGRKRGGGRVDPPGSPAARRRAFLQVRVEPPVGCAAATCLGCTVPGVDGPQRACREGPVFAFDEIAWEAAS
jgi:dihydroorotate dehydrogenase electron transfer subunit